MDEETKNYLEARNKLMKELNDISYEEIKWCIDRKIAVGEALNYPEYCKMLVAEGKITKQIEDLDIGYAKQMTKFL